MVDDQNAHAGSAQNTNDISGISKQLQGALIHVFLKTYAFANFSGD